MCGFSAELKSSRFLTRIESIAKPAGLSYSQPVRYFPILPRTSIQSTGSANPIARSRMLYLAALGFRSSWRSRFDSRLVPSGFILVIAQKLRKS